MSHKLKTTKRPSVVIWWVDDDFLEKSSNNLRIFNKLHKYKEIKTEKFTPREFINALETEDQSPDLFLVDYKLDQNRDPSDNNKKFPYTGTGLVGFIRDKFPEHPIYLVSQLLKGENVSQDNDLFDRLMDYGWFQERGQITAKRILKCDAEDYRSIRNVRSRSGIDPIYRLLNVPKSSKEDVRKVIPESLRHGIGKTPSQNNVNDNILTSQCSGVIQLALWVRENLMRHAGVLYSDLYASTYLGMTISYFKNSYVPHKLKNANDRQQYTGVFYQSEDRRWWKRELAEFLYSLPEAKDISVGQTWISGPEILKLTKNNRSRCIVCDEFSPETVGYDKDDRNELHPVHWRCSDIDPEVQLHPYYDQVRLIRE